MLSCTVGTSSVTMLSYISLPPRYPSFASILASACPLLTITHQSCLHVITLDSSEQTQSVFSSDAFHIHLPRMLSAIQHLHMSLPNVIVLALIAWAVI